MLGFLRVPHLWIAGEHVAPVIRVEGEMLHLKRCGPSVHHPIFREIDGHPNDREILGLSLENHPIGR
jgi:hypothetical protein